MLSYQHHAKRDARPRRRERTGALPKLIKSRMVELLARLADWPNVSGAKALSGKLAGRYRLRTGD
jgi:hypothetical protein